MRQRRYGDMTVTMAKLITELATHGKADLKSNRWVVRGSNASFLLKSIEAAYDRCLIKIVGTPWGTTQFRQTAELTKIGEYAAAGLVHVTDEHQPVSEASSLMITEALVP